MDEPRWNVDGVNVDGLRNRRTVSVGEAAAFLGIARSTAYNAVRDGSLPSVRLSHRLLVPTAKLLAMVGVEEQVPHATCAAARQERVAGAEEVV